METLSTQQIIEILEKQRIKGVFSGTKEIENVINVRDAKIAEIIKNQNLNFVKVTQNCNNSKKILEDLKDKGEIIYDR